MKNPAPKNITQILQNSTLSRIVERADEINGLNRKIQKILPQSLQGLYRVVNLLDNRLIINVQSAAVRQGLLLQQTALLAQIRAELPHIEGIEFKLSPGFK